MDNILILKAAHHMDDRIHLADICQELVSKSLTFGGTLYQTRDVHELDDRRRHFFGMIEISKQLQTLIRHRHHAHIRIDGTERVVRALRPCLCQRIE